MINYSTDRGTEMLMEWLSLQSKSGSEKWWSNPIDLLRLVFPRAAESQAWILIIRTDAEAEAPIFGHLMQRANSLEEILMLGKIEGRRRNGQQRMRWLDSITKSMDMNLSKPQEIAENRGAWNAAVHGGHKESNTNNTNSYWVLMILQAFNMKVGLPW